MPMKLLISRDTVFKKQPVQSSKLSLKDKVYVRKGESFEIVAYKKDKFNHIYFTLKPPKNLLMSDKVTRYNSLYGYIPHLIIDGVDLINNPVEVKQLPHGDYKLTVKQIRAIMPYCPLARAKQFADPINDTLERFDINKNKQRIAFFLATIAVESGELRYTEEIASGAAYEWRKDLGNVFAGDGRRFKGSGIIQLTGRGNATRAGLYFGEDFISHPEKMRQLPYAVLTAGWFWLTHNLNHHCDRGDFRRVTRIVNGGLTHIAEREAYLARAKKVLGV